MVHLVYCDNAGKKGERVLDKILSGTKTMIVRGAAGRKIPHSRVFEGERLYFIEKGSSWITASAVVKAVQNHVKLSEEEITEILERLGDEDVLDIMCAYAERLLEEEQLDNN